MNCLDKLPDELKWNVIKFMQHPTVDMIHEAECDYKAHLRGMEYALDGWRPAPPPALVREYEEITLLKYLKQRQEDRHERNKYFRERREGFHAQEWFCDYCSMPYEKCHCPNCSECHKPQRDCRNECIGCCYDLYHY